MATPLDNLHFYLVRDITSVNQPSSVDPSHKLLSFQRDATMTWEMLQHLRSMGNFHRLLSQFRLNCFSFRDAVALTGMRNRGKAYKSEQPWNAECLNFAERVQNSKTSSISLRQTCVAYSLQVIRNNFSNLDFYLFFLYIVSASLGLGGDKKLREKIKKNSEF